MVTRENYPAKADCEVPEKWQNDEWHVTRYVAHVLVHAARCRWRGDHSWARVEARVADVAEIVRDRRRVKSPRGALTVVRRVFGVGVTS